MSWLDAKVRNGERMDDVLRRHDEPDRLVHRNVQGVDLARPIRVLELHIYCFATTWISIAELGGRSCAVWFDPAHQKKKRKLNRVATVQPISN